MFIKLILVTETKMFIKLILVTETKMFIKLILVTETEDIEDIELLGAGSNFMD